MRLSSIYLRYMKKFFIELIGWMGMLFVLLSYVLVSFSVLGPRSVSYQLLAGFGSLGLVISSYYKKDFQSLTLNLIWACIATFVLISVLVNR